MPVISLKSFNYMMKTFGQKEQDQDQLIHELACSAIYHSLKDGQITPANVFIAKLGNSRRKNDLISWMCT